MITYMMEIYVGNETAKLLKKAGFSWPTLTFYNSNGIFIKSNEARNWNEDDGKNHQDISAPTLGMAHRWLREVKGIHVSTCNKCDPNNCRPIEWEWYYDSGVTENDEDEKIYDTYEEAIEAGICSYLDCELSLKNNE